MQNAKSHFSILALLGIAICLAVGTGAASAATGPQEVVLSFDMWCLEMQLYPSPRCDARQTEDVGDYEQYRKSVEQFDSQCTTKEVRDQEFLQKLNQNTGNTKSNAEGKEQN